MKTPLQELIEIIEREKISFEDMFKESIVNDEADKFLETSSSAHFMCSMFLSKAKELLPKEKEVIMKAFTDGDERGTCEIPFNCEQYYQQTYNN